MAENAAAQAINSNAEATLLTATITPQSTASRIRVDAQCTAWGDPANNPNNQDFRLKVRLYRGSVLLSELEAGNDHQDRQDHSHWPFSPLAVDSPASAAQQTYTLRAIRQGASRPWSVSRRRLVLMEVL